MRAARARRGSALAGLVAGLMLVIAGCNAAALTPAPTATPVATDTPAPSDSASAGATDAPGLPDSPAAGIVVGVDSAGLDQVKGFTLRTNDGETIVFRLGTLENADEFPAGHLKEHQTTAAPILVFFRPNGADLVVYRIEDAG